MPTAAVLGVTAVAGAVSSRNASKRAAAAQKKSAQTASEETKRSTAQARKDLFNLFPSAQQNVGLGFQGALDVFGQSLPAQTNVFQQGNIGAQQQLLSGLPLIQNALLGGTGPIDFSSLQPTQIQTPNLGFFQQQLPQFTSPIQQNQIGIEQDTGVARGAANGSIFGPFPNRRV